MPFRNVPTPQAMQSAASPELRPAFSTFFLRRYQSIPFARAGISMSFSVHWSSGSTFRDSGLSLWECRMSCVKKTSRNVLVNGCRLMNPNTYGQNHYDEELLLIFAEKRRPLRREIHITCPSWLLCATLPHRQASHLDRPPIQHRRYFLPTLEIHSKGWIVSPFGLLWQLVVSPTANIIVSRQGRKMDCTLSHSNNNAPKLEESHFVVLSSMEVVISVSKHQHNPNISLFIGCGVPHYPSKR